MTGRTPDADRSRIGELLGCRVPIVLAGMGGVARSELVAAVTEAGGFGFLGMVREPPGLIESEVAALRRREIERFGVNIIPAATDPELLEAQLATIIALAVPVVGLFWEIDARVVARLRAHGIGVVYQIGSVAEAVAAVRAGASAIIAQGREAGGHVRGRTPLGQLLPAVVDTVEAPVLAAGGLSSGDDLLAARALGAEGIVLGTAFIATEESFAHLHHKERLLAATAEDTLTTEMFHINWPEGARVRVLKSEVTAGARGRDEPGRRVVIGQENSRPIYLFSTDSPLRSMTGDFEAMALYAGTGVGAATRIRPAGEIVRELTDAGHTAPFGTAATADIELSSSACYLGEMSGAYVGQLEPDEIAAALSALTAELRAELRREASTRPADAVNAPPFTAHEQTLAHWIARLSATRRTLPAVPPGETGAGRAPDSVLEQLGRLIPGLPDSELRTALSELRLWLET